MIVNRLALDGKFFQTASDMTFSSAESGLKVGR